MEGIGYIPHLLLYILLKIIHYLYISNDYEIDNNHFYLNALYLRINKYVFYFLGVKITISYYSILYFVLNISTYKIGICDKTIKNRRLNIYL